MSSFRYVSRWLSWAACPSRRLRSWRIEWIVAQDCDAALVIARAYWRRATVVDRGPTGFGARISFEYELASTLARHFGPECERFLVDCAVKDSPYASAYCIVALGLLHSKELTGLRSKLPHRTEMTRWRLGCYSSTATLGDLVGMEDL